MLQNCGQKNTALNINFWDNKKDYNASTVKHSQYCSQQYRINSKEPNIKCRVPLKLFVAYNSVFDK